MQLSKILTIPAALLLLLSTSGADAASPPAQEPAAQTNPAAAPAMPKIQVHLFDADADGSAFNDAAYEVHRAPEAAKPLLPSPRARDALYSRAGIAQAVQEWDAVEKDMLYLRARELPASELQAAYPKLDPKALARLSDTVPRI